MGELLISRDDCDRARLRVRGDGRHAALDVFTEASAAVLAASPVRLIVDLDGLVAADSTFVAALNLVARQALAAGCSVAVELPIGSHDWLLDSHLEDGVRIERTETPVQQRAQLPALRPARAAPSPGAPRREGHGFVTSYGDGRVCAESGCATTLSRYNNHDRCAIHWLGLTRR